MSQFILFIDPAAHADIQEAISYYNSKVKDLGKKFHLEVKTAFKLLSERPYFQIRYEDVRCLPLKKFPFMVHYKIHEELNAVTIYGVTHTSLNPDKHCETS